MKKIKLNKEALNILQQLKQAFIDKFGREPGPNDPIFFDPDADEPRFFSGALIAEMHETLCRAMRDVGIDPAIIYAYNKTGRILTAKNNRDLSQADLKEWQDAINEYYAQNDSSAQPVNHMIKNGSRSEI